MLGAYVCDANCDFSTDLEPIAYPDYPLSEPNSFNDGHTVHSRLGTGLRQKQKTKSKI